MKYYNLFALAGLLTLSACSKQEGPLNTETNTSTLVDNREKVSLALNLSGEARMIFDGAQDKNRGITYSINEDAKGADIAPLTAKNLYSIAVISDEQGTETHTFYLEWNKSTEDGRYYVKEIGKNDIDGKPIAKLDLNKEWFISGVLTTSKDKIDVANRKINFTPNADISPVNHDGTPSNKRSIGKNQIQNDIPLYFGWTKLIVPAINEGRDAISTIKRSQTLGAPSIKIRPMGTLMRIKVRNNNDYAVRVKSLRVFSSVFATKDGAIDLKGYNYSQKAEEIKYVPVQTTEDELHDMADFDLEPRQTYDHDFLVWGAPMKPITSGGTTYFTGRPFSQIILNVKRLEGGVEQERPKMDALYVWGSEYNNPKQSTRLRITANITRPMGVLEYFSDGYWDGTTNGHSFTTAPEAYVLKNNLELYDMTDNEFPSEYKALSYNDGRLLAPTWTVYNRADFPNAETNSAVVGGSTSTAIIFPGEPNPTTTKDSIQQINGVLYALRFDDGKEAGKRKHLSAWRYNYANATIESVYLGPSFKGVFSDLLKDSFWRNHASDIVKRTYAPTKTIFFRTDNGQPVEWYYQRYADITESFSSPILLSSIKETTPSASPTEKTLIVLGISLAYGSNKSYYVSGFRYRGKKGAYQTDITLYPIRLATDEIFPDHIQGAPLGVPYKDNPNRYYGGPKIQAVAKAPVILVKKNADY